MRRFCDESVTPLTNIITESEGNVSADEARLQCLENDVVILPDTVTLVKSFRDCLSGIEGRLPTNDGTLTEKDEHKVTLTRFRRDVNGLLEMEEARSRAMDHPEHAHVTEAQGEDDVSIKEEEKLVPRTQPVQRKHQYHRGQDYSTQESINVRRAFPDSSPHKKYHSRGSQRKTVIHFSFDEEEEKVSLLS